MTPAESHVLTCAHAYAAAMQAETAARTTYKLTKRSGRYPDPEGHELHMAMLTAEDAATEARGALIRAVRKLEPEESKFDVVGAP